jgi:UDP-2,3-diacylglucosamine pyrophosphatase LpxH
MKLAWVTDIHLNFLESADRKRFYQDIVATNSNAVLVSGDIAEVTTVSDILEEMARQYPFAELSHIAQTSSQIFA